MLWDKQIEVFEAINKYKRVAVKSGNTVGKSRIASEIALWYLTTRYPSKVITTAPGWGQIEDILWKEIASLYYKSKHPLGGELLKTQLNMNEHGDWFAIGLSTKDKNHFQGRHSPNLLVIIDEALGVTPEIWQAIYGLHPTHMLAIGNPLYPEGEFFKCFLSDLWHKITISCLDCVKWQNKHGKIPGLVTLDWIEERAQEWGKKSALFLGHVLGEFPLDVENSLIKRSWVEFCRNKDSEDHEEDSIRIVASDVATKHGTGKTAICYRYGHTIPEIKTSTDTPVPQIAGKVKHTYESKHGDNIVIDSDGIGEGVADILTNQRLGVLEFHGGYGAKAMDSHKFKNLRSQFYCVMAKKFEKGLYSLKQLPQEVYEKLLNQLCAIKMKAPDVQGRLQIETKDDMRARGIASPDEMDSLMMSEFGYFMGRMSDIKAYRYR